MSVKSGPKFKKLQTPQNKRLRICLKASWFMYNKQIHNTTGIPYLSEWIKSKAKSFHSKLQPSEEAIYYNLGEKT